jgi:hypothetical protein
MLLRPDTGDATILIGQAAHAWVSGQLAARWAAPIPHREAALLAAVQHDVGMAHHDLTPDLDPGTGWPVGFMQMRLATHLRLWSLAPQRLFTQSRTAALIVSLHGTNLYARRDLGRLAPEEADDVRAYLAGQRALQRALAAEAGVTDEELATLQRLMFTWDWLSLALCLKWAPATFAEGGLTLTETTIEPWPFTGDEIEVVVEGRRLAERASTRAELHAAIERAERVDLRFTLTRAPSGAP